MGAIASDLFEQLHSEPWVAIFRDVKGHALMVPGAGIELGQILLKGGAAPAAMPATDEPEKLKSQRLPHSTGRHLFLLPTPSHHLAVTTSSTLHPTVGSCQERDPSRSFSEVAVRSFPCSVCDACLFRAGN